MVTLNKKSCPKCGRAVNERQIALFSGMVNSLKLVYRWCLEKERHEFSRKDIKHLLRTDNEIARFGDWVLFGGLVYKKGRGKYGLNLERCHGFFTGELAIPTLITKDMLSKEMKHYNYQKIFAITSLSGLLDEEKDYMAKYGEPPVQAAMF